ncbi:hypothetical protein AK88_05445 [Plasmodium fragile]|uniref:Schizont-infected cell agglutination C-terminal domain-containing protein n=1 Tax=Plasmodium fragile TaxID=5857 RepID=A0A0D9QCZ1_PLAFR|nr:uncharacterized protein AK88_05445 [Plasmodium fragile]KJP84925.1 hypothetical protein AK88_05445 [Plasmodium fragile]
MYVSAFIHVHVVERVTSYVQDHSAVGGEYRCLRESENPCSQVDKGNVNTKSNFTHIYELFHLQNRIYRDVDDIFTEVTTVISRRNGWNSGICGELYSGADDRLCISRCEVLGQIYGNSSDHRDIIEKVRGKLQQGATILRGPIEPALCEERDYGKFIFGSGIIGQHIGDRLQEWKKGSVIGKATSGHGATAKCRWQDTETKNEQQPESTKQCIATVQAAKHDEDTKELMELIDVNITAPSMHLKRLIQQSLEPRTRCTMREKIRKNVQEKVWDIGETVRTGKPRTKGTSNTLDPASNPRRPRPGIGPGRKPKPPLKESKPSKPKSQPSAPKDRKTAQSIPSAGGSGDGPQAPKPAPAKPAPPAKPVAAKPPDSGTKKTVTTTTGGAMTTTSSGGGGKGGTPSTAVAVGGQHENGNMANPQDKECTGERIVQQGRNAVYVVPPRDDNAWNKWKQVLQAFTEYMQDHNDLNEAYGANCYNTGWNDFGKGNDSHTQQRVADVVRCRVMSVAWAFANGWGHSASANTDGVDITPEEKDMFRCEVVNIFGHLLKEKYCSEQKGYKRGVEYSRIAFRDMKSAGINGVGAINGPVIEGRCTACGYQGHERWAHAINLKVVEWLMHHGEIMNEIAQMEQAMPCTERWTDYIKQIDHPHNPIKDGNTEGRTLKERLSEEGQRKIQDAEQQLEGAVTKIIENVAKDTDDILQQAQEAFQDVPKNAHKDATETTPGAKPMATTPATPKPVAGGTPGQGTGTGGDVARKDDDEQPPARPPPPPPPEPARPAENTGAPGDAGPAGPQGETGAKGEPGPTGPKEDHASGADAGPAPDSKEPRQPGSSAVEDYKSICEQTDSGPQSTTVISSGASSVSITPVNYNYGAEAPCKILQELAKQEERAKSTPKTVENTKNATRDRAPSGETNVQGDTVPAGTVDGNPQEAAKAASPTTPAPAEEKAKEPPPPSAPAPGPTPSTGTATDGTKPPTHDGDPDANDVADGIKNTADFGFGLDLNPLKAKGDLGGSYGLGTPQGPRGVPPSPKADSSNVPPALDAPTLTWEDLIPYTPAIIPAVVGIGIIAFFLWKYFAFLGHKRRRTYRTVRDIPSPPLDEEILDHLQRGELPPPDYGYTMVRARRRDKFADRRRRHPRVHKRTIIELHLEVLNECEATEWENVKDEYWQIVVEEFSRDLAQDLMRDGKGYSSSLDAPSTNQGYPGINVSSTLDRPTDIERTDPCRPNEQDPDAWNCMETKQLATGPCAPHEHDPDPWSCMENIQLETHPCPPHDPDPWSCMETIQLAPGPCAPHAHDPDRCSSMQHIQLATDRSAPNEDDRWNCMENIPLATDPSPPNEHDPWKCMETIQLHDDQHRPFDHGDETLDCIHWINWIDRNKYFLRECTTQTRFLQLKADWKQYYQQHATNDAFGVNRKAATMDSKKHAWKEWVAKQHRQMRMYNAEAWFQRLLNTVVEETQSHKGEVPGVETDVEVENVMAAEDMLRVRDLPRSQPLHKQPYMKKPLTAQTWILILALIIEACELENSMHDRELYVDALLQNM